MSIDMYRRAMMRAKLDDCIQYGYTGYAHPTWGVYFGVYCANPSANVGIAALRDNVAAIALPPYAHSDRLRGS